MCLFGECGISQVIAYLVEMSQSLAFLKWQIRTPKSVISIEKTKENVSLLCLIIANLDYISLQIWAKKWPLIIIPAIYWYNILVTIFFAKFESCDFTPLIQMWNFSLTTYKLKSNILNKAWKSGNSYKSFSRVLSYYLKKYQNGRYLQYLYL